MKFLLLIILGFVLDAQEVFLSLPAAVDAALENPERANRLLATVTRPADPLITHLETEIRTELRARDAELACRQRERQELIAKVRYLYFRANDDPECRKLLLRLNDLPDDLPAHADDSVYDALQPMVWNGEQRLAAIARRNRADLRLSKNNTIRYAFRIQFGLANYHFDQPDKDAPGRVPALIELANLCAWSPEKERLPFTPSPLPGGSEPVLVPETPSPLFNIYVTTFRLVDWSAY